MTRKQNDAFNAHSSHQTILNDFLKTKKTCLQAVHLRPRLLWGSFKTIFFFFIFFFYDYSFTKEEFLFQYWKYAITTALVFLFQNGLLYCFCRKFKKCFLNTKQLFEILNDISLAENFTYFFLDLSFLCKLPQLKW